MRKDNSNKFVQSSSDIGKSAINAGKTVGKAASVISAAKDAAIEKGKVVLLELKTWLED